MTSQDFYLRKMCTRCRELKAPADFPTNPGLSSGRDSWCRSCHNAATAAWRAAHPEHAAAYNAARRLPAYPPRPCAVCSESFTPRRRDQRYCGSACRARRARA